MQAGHPRERGVASKTEVHRQHLVKTIIKKTTPFMLGVFCHHNVASEPVDNTLRRVVTRLVSRQKKLIAQSDVFKHAETRMCLLKKAVNSATSVAASNIEEIAVITSEA